MKPTLIIVDDVRSVRVRLRRHLEDRFDVIAEAADGDEAVKLVVGHRPALVTMDVVMPTMSGIEAVKAIQKSLTPPPKIVMVSGVTDERVVLQALEAGAVEFVFKPVDVEKLSQILWRASQSVA